MQDEWVVVQQQQMQRCLDRLFHRCLYVTATFKPRSNHNHPRPLAWLHTVYRLTTQVLVRSTECPDTEYKLERRVINRAILVEDPFCILLLPSPIWLLSTHDQPHTSLDGFGIRALGVNECKQGPRGHDDLRVIVLGVFTSNAGLLTQLRSLGTGRRLTMYVSPHPPSAICLLIKKSHALRTRSELS